MAIPRNGPVRDCLDRLARSLCPLVRPSGKVRSKGNHRTSACGEQHCRLQNSDDSKECESSPFIVERCVDHPNDRDGQRREDKSDRYVFHGISIPSTNFPKQVPVLALVILQL